MYDVNIIIKDETLTLAGVSTQLGEIPKIGEFLKSYLLDKEYGYNNRKFKITNITRRYNDDMSELDYVEIELLVV